MPDDPIRLDVSAVDLLHRFPASSVVVGSPAAAAETIIAPVTVGESEQVDEGVLLDGWAALTIGTAGTAIRLRLRRGGIGGTVIGDTGALTGGIVAAALVAQDVAALDTAPVLPNQQYTLTLQVTGANAVTTVSAVVLKAIAV